MPWNDQPLPDRHGCSVPPQWAAPALAAKHAAVQGQLHGLKYPSSAFLTATLIFLTAFKCPQVLGLKPVLSSGALNPTAAEFVPGGLPPALAAKISAVNEQLRNPGAAPSMPPGTANASAQVQSRPFCLQRMRSLHAASTRNKGGAGTAQPPKLTCQMKALVGCATQLCGCGGPAKEESVSLCCTLPDSLYRPLLSQALDRHTENSKIGQE